MLLSGRSVILGSHIPSSGGPDVESGVSPVGISFSISHAGSSSLILRSHTGPPADIVDPVLALGAARAG